MINLGDHAIILGDVYDGLSCLENNFFDVAITSPPYWGQRDYDLTFQIGAEETYLEYIQILVKTFSLLKCKLKEKGVFFLNIGDKYLSKYGNSSLGMIPYKLASSMCNDGWILNDIIIWYKPNHMPSSIKNRFSNTYEPIFVFSTSNNNYYLNQKKIQNFSNILKIKTQPTPFSHVAVYPEKLVETLLNYSIPTGGSVLDPFAGSGTTCKAAQNLTLPLNNVIFSSTMIEANAKYVEIIKSRCSIANDKVLVPPEVTRKPADNYFEYKSKIKRSEINFNIPINKKFIKVFDNLADYLSFIDYMKTDEGKKIIKEDGILYVGVKSIDIDVFTSTSLLIDYGWVIRNQLIIKNNNSWFPIYFIVRDIKSTEYVFNLDGIRIKHKSKNNNDYFNKSFVGYKVIDNSNKEAKRSGTIISIEERYTDGFPKFSIINWDDDLTTKEYVIHSENPDVFLSFNCPFCHSSISKYYSNGNSNCEKCKQPLWTSIVSIPILKEDIPYNDIGQEIKYIKDRKSDTLIFEKIYNGKFKSESKINMGASLGARASTQEEYFSVQRLYNVNQAMVADYLNILRESKGYSKNGFTELFSKFYKHTVGHWLRKDMGGSLPTMKDLQLICKYLPIEKSYYNYINRRAIKLQTVSNSHKGKNPGDFFEVDLEKVNKILLKTFSI